MSQEDAAAPAAADGGTGKSAATMHNVSVMLSNVARKTNTAETAVTISNSTEDQPTMVHMNEVALLAAEIAEKYVKQILDSLLAPFLFGGTCESAAATALTYLMGAAHLGQVGNFGLGRNQSLFSILKHCQQPLTFLALKPIKSSLDCFLNKNHDCFTRKVGIG